MAKSVLSFWGTLVLFLSKNKQKKKNDYYLKGLSLRSPARDAITSKAL